MSLLRSPLLHFAVGGALLFCLVHGRDVQQRVHRPPVPGRSSEPVVVTAADVERLRRDYERETGLTATDDDEAALVERTIREELLFREALARGLDRDDRSVRNWLVEQMEVLSDQPGADPDTLLRRARALGLDRSDLVVRRILVQKMRLLAARSGEATPSEDDLREYLAAHADDYRAPPRIDLWQVFFANHQDGEAARTRALAALEAVRRDGANLQAAAGRGEAFAVPAHLVGQSAAQIEKLFGPAFARELAAAPTGEWAGPFASSAGWHIVRVDRREGGAVPDLNAVRSQLAERWQQEQRERRVAALLLELEAQTRFEVASDAWQRRAAGRQPQGSGRTS